MSTNQYHLTVASTDAVIASQMELADSAWKRMQGLLGRGSLAADAGMRFDPASSLHMMFMRFAIDVVYVDREERVVKLVRDFKPWRFSWARGARTAYELSTGSIDRSGVAIGDLLELRAVDRPMVA